MLSYSSPFLQCKVIIVFRSLQSNAPAFGAPSSDECEDEDISLDACLPLEMDEIYRVRERIYERVIELQEKYGIVIHASAVPEQ
jgi:hypothetical protein